MLTPSYFVFLLRAGMFWSVLLWLLSLSLSLVISTDLRTPLASSPRLLPHLSPFFLLSVVQYQGASLSVHKQSGPAPEHLTRRLLSTEPMLSLRWAALLCPSSTASVTPDLHHPCRLHRPAFLWGSLLHTSYSSFQMYLFLTGG